MDDTKQKELVMDEIKIEKLQDISGGSISTLQVINKPLILGGMAQVPTIVPIIPILALNVVSENKNK